MMLTQQDAEKLVERYLAEMYRECDFEVVLNPNSTLERPFGWMFFYDTREALEIGNSRNRLAGNGGLIVERSTGEVHTTGSRERPEYYLDEFERAHGY